MSRLCLIQLRCTNELEHRQFLLRRRGKACHAGLFLWAFLTSFFMDFWAPRTAVENALAGFRIRASQSVMKRQDTANSTVIHP
jgi:hypothetical protein